MRVQFPAALVREDRILVVAPSGPFEPQLLDAGLKQLDGFQLVTSPAMSRRSRGFLAGSDQERLAELQDALDDPHGGAILIARGGYGIARIAPALNWERFLKNPKWLIGFSDATVLHQALSKVGVASIHAPNGTTLARSDERDVAALRQILCGQFGNTCGELEVVVPGRAEGALFGGNLTVLFTEAASGRLDIPDGSVLFLEDITETSYRIDRMLTALLSGGQLERASGIVLGDFTDCSPGRFRVPVEDVLRERLSTLKIPILAGLPVGHGIRNHPLVLGATATLDSQTRSLVLRAA